VKPFVVRVERRMNASAERVFDAWLDPARVPLWFAPGLGPMTRVHIDARVGGGFSFMQRRGDEDVDHVGEYLEIDRPRRLVFTWSMPQYTEDVSKVSLDIVPDGNGSHVTLVHEMDPKWAEYAERTRDGWEKMLHLIDAMPG
jgi:uncharacterized protein YndB with AHSA1/START domain